MAEEIAWLRDIHDTLAQGFTGSHHAIGGGKRRNDARRTLPKQRIGIERASDLARSSLGEARRLPFARLRLSSLRPAGKLFLGFGRFAQTL